MKREEKIARKYFLHNGYKQIIFEPDGNIPPDFLLNYKIAVEVRRLNKYFNGAPLEFLEYKIIPIIQKILKEFEHIKSDKTDFINIRFSRPLKVNRNFKNKIREILQIQVNNLGEKRLFKVNENIEIEFFPSEKSLHSPFSLGGYTDNNSFGFIICDIYENLKFIIKEKEHKIQPYRARYKTWWLLLIDYIGYGLTEADLKELKKLPFDKHIFKKIIFVSPINPEQGAILNF
jgi:hypothetical protein